MLCVGGWQIYLSHLKISNFRNLADAELLLEPGVTIIHGNNGNGKSNLLEAIYILSIGKSQRATNDKDLIRFISAELDTADNSLDIHTKVSANIQRPHESTKIQFGLFEIDSGGARKHQQNYNVKDLVKQRIN